MMCVQIAIRLEEGKLPREVMWPALCSGSEFHCGRMREQRPKLGPLLPFCGVVHIPADTSGQGRFRHRCCMIIICPKIQLFKCSTCTIPFKQPYYV